MPVSRTARSRTQIDELEAAPANNYTELETFVCHIACQNGFIWITEVQLATNASRIE